MPDRAGGAGDRRCARGTGAQRADGGAARVHRGGGRDRGTDTGRPAPWLVALRGRRRIAARAAGRPVARLGGAVGCGTGPGAAVPSGTRRARIPAVVRRGGDAGTASVGTPGIGVAGRRGAGVAGDRASHAVARPVDGGPAPPARPDSLAGHGVQRAQPLVHPDDRGRAGRWRVAVASAGGRPPDRRPARRTRAGGGAGVRGARWRYAVSVGSAGPPGAHRAVRLRREPHAAEHHRAAIASRGGRAELDARRGRGRRHRLRRFGGRATRGYRPGPPVPPSMEVVPRPRPPVVAALDALPRNRSAPAGRGLRCLCGGRAVPRATQPDRAADPAGAGGAAARPVRGRRRPRGTGGGRRRPRAGTHQPGLGVRGVAAARARRRPARATRGRRLHRPTASGLRQGTLSRVRRSRPGPPAGTGGRRRARRAAARRG